MVSSVRAHSGRSSIASTSGAGCAARAGPDAAPVEGAARRLPEFEARSHAGIVLTADIDTMQRLVDAAGSIRKVNLGGIHHRAGRAPKLRYVFLTAKEEAALRAMAAGGVTITAQDVPAAEPMALHDVLAGSGA